MLLPAALIFGVLVLAGMMLALQSRTQRRLDELPSQIDAAIETRHRAMLADLHQGLTAQSDRMQTALLDHSERLRSLMTTELGQLREALHTLQSAQAAALAGNRETLQQSLHDLSQSQAGELARSRETLQFQLAESAVALKAAQSDFLGKTLQSLADQGRADQLLLQTTLQQVGAQLTQVVDTLNKTVESRLADISGKVAERLDDGFKKTNETFASVMARLATIDEAQKKIDGLTSNVVSLQTLLGDKRSRGAFGEVQLESLVRNILPPDACAFQVTLSNGTRADCLLKLPSPTGNVAIDAKFPLENYHRMIASDLPEADRIAATRAFKADIRKHIDDIASKYIIEGETSEGAVMFVPAEAVFAEIHGNHAELNEYAQQRRVWIVSPTTLMAVLNTARAVIKDVETRRQVHIIQDELARLGKEFGRFDQRMKKLADHIRQAHEDASEVQVTSQKISRRFSQIEAVDLEHLRRPPPAVLPGEDNEP